MIARQRSYPPPITREQLLPFGFSDPNAAAGEVNELLEAVFGPADEAAREVWQMLDEEELAPRAMASFLRQAAGAPDPLAFADRDETARSLLNARMRARWSTRAARAAGHPSSVAGLGWSDLPESAREMVREALLQLAEYQDAVSRATTVRKDRTDTVVRELAALFARGTGLNSPWAVPHAGRSRFVQFALAVLHGHLAVTELEPGAIAERWRRLKRAEERGAAEPAADPGESR